MEPDFWLARWREGKIGFHLPEANPLLVAHRRLLPEPTGRAGLLVPLCGKSHDLVWLAGQGYRVVGVELSELACQTFLEEQGLDHERSETDGYVVYDTDTIRLICGDMLRVPAELVGSIAGVYDRAALVALPEPLRDTYAARLAALLPAGAAGLLISLEYDATQMGGPPFSVAEADVQRVLGDSFAVQHVTSQDALASNARFAELGLSRLDEAVYGLKRR